MSGSTKYALWSSSITNVDLDGSVSILFHTGMNVYCPGDITNICMKFVTLLNQQIDVNITINPTSVICLLFWHCVVHGLCSEIKC